MTDNPISSNGILLILSLQYKLRVKAFLVICYCFVHVFVRNEKISLNTQIINSHSTYVLCLNLYTVKPVLSDHSKIDKTNVLKTNGSLMKVESIAECSLGAFCNTFDLH